MDCAEAVLEIIGKRLTAGLAWDWTASLRGLDPARQTVTLYLRGPGSIDLVGAASGSSFRFQASKAQTAALPGGIYNWQAVADDAGIETIIATGRVSLQLDLRLGAEGADARSFAERMLAMVEAVLENRATLEQRRYQINNRSLDRTPVADLMKLRTQFRAQISAEQAKRAGRSPFGRRVLTRF